MNREDYLMRGVTELTALFNREGYAVPSVKVSVGRCSGRGSKNKAIGECWAASAADDNIAQIFIDPSLDDSSRVLDVLAHELVHAVVGTAVGHKGEFKKCATSIGLEGKMTATTASAKLAEELSEIISRIGEYPHAKLNMNSRKKQTTRLIKAKCDYCGYTVRLSRIWIDEVGYPICPADKEEMSGVF